MKRFVLVLIGVLGIAGMFGGVDSAQAQPYGYYGRGYGPGYGYGPRHYGGYYGGYRRGWGYGPRRWYHRPYGYGPRHFYRGY